MQNFSEGGFKAGVLEGLVEVPVHETEEPFVDLEDLAEVAVAALLDDRHVGQTYALTGPELLSWPNAVGRIAQAAEREVRFSATTAEGFQQTLIADGYPADDALFVAELVAAILDGRNANLGDGVQRALGRDPTDFDTFVQRAVQAGAWTSQPERQ